MVTDIGQISLKPFRLMKFFTFTSLVVILFSTLVLSWVISNYTKNVLLDRSEAYAQVYAENLNHQVFQQFVLPTVLRYGAIALRYPRQFERLDAIVRNTTHGMNIESVSIYDSNENVISYSTVAERVGSRDAGGDEYRRALKGENNSVLISSGNLLSLLPGASPISCKLITYIPFRQERALSQSTDVIMGVIEVEQVLSADLAAIVRLQGIIILTSVVIMGSLFGVLQFIVARADRIIEARAEERYRLEKKLNHAERLATLGKMITSVSHEIKNPLGIVKSTAEILEKRLKSVAPGNEHLATIVIEETGRLDNIVREFLDFARPQDPKKKLLDVNKGLLKAVEFMSPEFDKHKIRLNLHIDEALDPVPLDENLIYRVYLNVLVNAAQAMPDGGRLTVRSARYGKKGVKVEIADEGVGIPDENLQRIFTPFYTDKIRGTGLGLAIVKNIIDSHGGKVEVESRKDVGTTFRL
ncbi:MAG: ATP-binding protein, partial [Desulfobulbaceae bacterium]|nr:ATP-binding protein [Desulfobulbaceae bacterium]